MIFPIVSLIVLFSALSLDSRESILTQNLYKFFPFIGLILICIVTFRPEEMADYQNYKYIFYSENYTNSEPGFIFINSLVSDIWPNLYFLFFIMALLSVSLNLIAIERYSQFKAMSVLFYVSNMFILHDMIQIRCAVAVAILLFAFKYIYSRQIIRFCICILIASLFHYSSIAFIFAYTFNKASLNRFVYISFLLLAYVFTALNITFGHLAQYVPIPFIQILFAKYTDSMNMGNDIHINIFNIAQLIRASLGIILIIYSNKILQYNKYAILFIKSYFWGVIFFVVFSDFPVLSFRISELFQHCEFITIPMLLYLRFKPQLLYKSIIITVALLFFGINVFYNKLLL